MKEAASDWTRGAARYKPAGVSTLAGLSLLRAQQSQPTRRTLPRVAAFAAAHVRALCRLRRRASPSTTKYHPDGRLLLTPAWGQRSQAEAYGGGPRAPRRPPWLAAAGSGSPRGAVHGAATAKLRNSTYRHHLRSVAGSLAGGASRKRPINGNYVKSRGTSCRVDAAPLRCAATEGTTQEFKPLE
jgi:hypothetical protein